jgi:hypothetical protein
VDEIVDFAQIVYNAFRLYFYLTFFDKPDGRVSSVFGEA